MPEQDAPSDEMLRAEVLAALAAEKRIAGGELHVGVLHGIVHLAGQVATMLERSVAEDAASQVAGVRGVVNRIDAPGAPSPARQIDLDLQV
ncbi:MAG: BON domain-containing protein [Anaerolineales bacterium]|jgi:osmotically-inducible protein OsmY|nr:BON domain-containing protein [Anaerolineales bacterium]